MMMNICCYGTPKKAKMHEASKLQLDISFAYYKQIHSLHS